MLASGVAMIRSEQPSSAALPAKHRPDAIPMRGTTPESRAQRANCHHVETGDHGVIGVARPAAATLGEEHDRQAESLHHLEKAVLLPVSYHSLSSSEDGVVVREHGAAGALVTDQRAIHTRSPGDQPVGRCAAHEIVDTAASALCRDRQPAVLDEAAGITEVVEILACCPAPGRVPSGDDLAAALVASQVAATERFREVGTRAGLLRFGHPMSLRAPVSCR